MSFTIVHRPTGERDPLLGDPNTILEDPAAGSSLFGPGFAFSSADPSLVLGERGPLLGGPTSPGGCEGLSCTITVLQKGGPDESRTFVNVDTDFPYAPVNDYTSVIGGKGGAIFLPYFIGALFYWVNVIY